MDLTNAISTLRIYAFKEGIGQEVPDSSAADAKG
jgi:hypothetical protein